MACTTLVACHDVSSFSTASGGVYEGPVTSASFVRTGIESSALMCLSIDTTQLQSAPGWISTNDGLFKRTPLRNIPQFWQDPLSTFNFGEGRIQNVLYAAAGAATDAGGPGDVMVIISFMVGGNVEVRLVRGAPPFTYDAGTGASGPDAAGDARDGGGDAKGSSAKDTPPPQIFAVFSLNRVTAPCPF
jgi:hypothetical protein